MSQPLAIYLEDHLAGSRLAIDLLEDMRNDHADDPLGSFAARLLAEIEQDRDVLETLVERGEAGSSGPFKETFAWLLEKLTRWKLRRRAGAGVGTLLRLEMLALGILGKHSLWRALETIAATDARLQGFDYGGLAARAQAQHDQVEERRLDVARSTLPRTG